MQRRIRIQIHSLLSKRLQKHPILLSFLFTALTRFPSVFPYPVGHGLRYGESFLPDSAIRICRRFGKVPVAAANMGERIFAGVKHDASFLRHAVGSRMVSSHRYAEATACFCSEKRGYIGFCAKTACSRGYSSSSLSIFRKSRAAVTLSVGTSALAPHFSHATVT